MTNPVAVHPAAPGLAGDLSAVGGDGPARSDQRGARVSTDALPPEAVYLPFEAGPYRMAMGLVTVPEPAWFELDEHYAQEMAERRRLLADRHVEVFGTVPGSDAARAETLAMMADHLPVHHPGLFSRDGHRLTNHVTGEAWDLADPPCDPLELAGRLVQEDLCVIQPGSEGPMFTAAVLCFPSRWRLHEKLGRPLGSVHGSVPVYPDRLARPVDRFMAHLRPDHIASRVNWSIVDDPALFQPTGKWRTEVDSAIDASTVGNRLFLRVERQTLRRLPRSGAVLFGIRVHRYRLDAVITDATIAARLADAVRALPAAVSHYKSLPPFQDALLGWLGQR